MGANQLRDLLSRLRWDRRATATGVVVEARERTDAGEVVRPLPFAAVADILPAGIALADGTFIPYHRVLTVRRGDEVLWRRRGRDDGEA